MRACILTFTTLAVALSACAGSERSPQTKAAMCNLFPGPIVGVLSIIGKPGEQANLELTCGGTLVANCIAVVPPGGNTDFCTLGPVPVNQEIGAYLCAPVDVVGRPTKFPGCRAI